MPYLRRGWPSVSRWSRSSKEVPFLGSCRFAVSPDVRVIQKSHSERHSVLFLNQFEQTLPSVEFHPADEKLRCPPPRTQFSADTPSFRAILIGARKSLLSYAAGHGRRLISWAKRLNQRFPDQPCLVRKSACSVPFFHPRNMGRVSRSNRS